MKKNYTVNGEIMDNEEDIELFERLNERIRELEDENYTLKEELKGDLEEDSRYVCVHNRLSGFDSMDYIPVSHIGDNLKERCIIEIQTGDESLNISLCEFITVLLNKGVFK